MMDKNLDFLLYQTADEHVSVNALIKGETIWLTQKSMAELFDCSPDNISLHLKNIFSERELDEHATAEEISVVQTEGNRQVRRNAFNRTQKITSDFDQAVNQMLKGGDIK